MQDRRSYRHVASSSLPVRFMSLSVLFLIVSLLVLVVDARRPSFTAAAILPGLFGGKSNNDGEKEGTGKQQQQQQQQQLQKDPKRPPPPPPPLLPNGDSSDESQNRQIDNQQQQQQQQPTMQVEANPADSSSVQIQGKKPPPPPPPQAGDTETKLESDPTKNNETGSIDEKEVVQEDLYLARNEQQQQQQQQVEPLYPYDLNQHQSYWNNPYPTNAASSGGWVQQPAPQQQIPLHHHHYQQQDDYYIEQELDASRTREASLVDEIYNLTEVLDTVQHREQTHLQQLQILTERVMDAESEAAAERNSVLEWQNNCSALEFETDELNQQLEDWKYKCKNLTEQLKEEEKTIMTLKKELKERSTEVEELAATIETARLDEEHDRYHGLKKKKKRSFWSWLFGARVDEESDDERTKLGQELARSSLLRALQAERESVHDLEAALVNAQQNNSVIAQIVESRDKLIAELNERITVFEEDKVVLKAALRQLQKEMQEEAPKAKKMAKELKVSRTEIDKLRNNMDTKTEEHNKQVTLLQKTITTKQAIIKSTQANMTVIGAYVDKLEERLASFAVARRDIQTREKRCEEIEEKLVKMEQEVNAVRAKETEYVSEQEKLKEKIEQLVVNRVTLEKEKEELTSSRDTLQEEERALRETIAALEGDVLEIEQIIDQWKARVSELENAMESQAVGLTESSKREAELCDKLEATLEDLDAVKANLAATEDKIATVTEQKAREAEAEMAAAAAQKAREEEEKMAAAAAQKAREEEEKMAALAAAQKAKEEEEKMAALAAAAAAQKAEEEKEKIAAMAAQRAREAKIRPIPPKLPGVNATKATNRTTTPASALKPPPRFPPKLPPTTNPRVPRRVPPSGRGQNQSAASKPFRGLRKAFAHATGLHGFFSSKKEVKQQPVRPTAKGGRTSRIQQRPLPPPKK